LYSISGGVDSIFVAAMARSIGARPHAMTVVTEGGIDEVNATVAAAALDMPHELIRLDATALVELARAAISGLGTSELWEVAAAIPLLAVSRSLDDRRHVEPVLTGSGADAVLAGAGF
jgi:asparagine synthase (glutamine-hydrolysing)